MASCAFSTPVVLPPALAARMRRALRGFDFATDLAEEIGTARWYRGLGLMLGGIGLAVALWPGIGGGPAIQSQPMDAVARQEWRSQTVQPLLYGGDTGSRMAGCGRPHGSFHWRRRPSGPVSISR